MLFRSLLYEFLVVSQSRYDREEYTRFWDEEEKRRKNGMVLPGKLIKENGVWKLQEIHR